MLRNLLWGASLVSVISMLGGCQPSGRVEVLQGTTMGSTYTIKYVSNSTTPAVDTAGVAVNEILDEVDRQMSTWRADSDLSRFNHLPADSCMAMPKPVLELVGYAQQLAAQTGGQFDISVTPLLKVWGFGPNSRGKTVPSTEQIEQARQHMGYQYLQIEDNQLCKQRELQLDLNSIAAGYTVDRIARRFEQLGIESYLIEVTGELIAKGKKPDGSPWRIAIEQPNDRAQVAQRILEIDGWGVNTSGDYRNYFEEDGVRFSHTLNAKTGAPISHRVAAVTVIDRSAMVADALGTVLLILGLEEGMQYSVEHDVAAMFIVRDGDSFVAHNSPRFEQIFPEGDKP